MIQELYFSPHSISRSINQVNTSVSLRYDTKTEKLQLIDVFGNTKTISIDTTPDMEPEDLSGLITVDYIKGLGFETAEQIEAKMPKYNAGYGINYDEATSSFFLSKGWLKARTSEYILSDDGKADVRTAVTVDYLTGLGVVTVDSDKDTLYSGESGIVIQDQKVSIDHDYLTGYLADIGYVPHDWDTIYSADEELLNLTHQDNKNTFVVNKEALSTFVGTYLDENKYINEQESPLTYAAGEGIGIVVDEPTNKNIISLTAHIPAYTAGEGIGITANGEDFEVAFTGHIPSGLKDMWADDQNIADIQSLGFALQADQSDTLYYAGTGITLTVDPNNNQNHFNIDAQWLDTFVKSYNYITGYVDTTYTGSDSITISGDNNSISVNTTWLAETIAPVIITNIGTEQGQTAVKNIVTKDYISGLGFRLEDEDEDTTYDGDESLNLVNTTFGVNTDWLANQTSSFISTNITSTWLSGTGIAISDTRVKDGIGITVEADENDGPVVKNQIININQDWLSGWIGNYNWEHNINGITLLAGDGISITTTEQGGKLFAVSAHIPTNVSELQNDTGFITGYVDTTYTSGVGIIISGDTNIVTIDQDWLRGFVASLGYVEVDNDTIYHADEETIMLTVEQGTEQLAPRNVFSVNTTWLDNYIAAKGFAQASAVTAIQESLENYAQLSDIPVVPTNVSEFTNDAGYLVDADLEALSATEVGSVATVTNYASGRAAQTPYNIINTVKQDKGIISAEVVALDANNVTFTPIDWDMRDTYFSLSAKIDNETVQAKTVGAALSCISKEICSINNKFSSVPTGLASWASGVNADYIASLGFRLSDNDTQYGVVQNGGLTVTSDHNFAIDTNWMSNTLAPYAQTSAVPTKVSELSNDKSYATLADLEAVKLSLMQQFANLTLVVNIDGDVNTPTQNVYVETDTPVTNNTTFTGKNITVTELNNNDSYVKFNSTGDVSISKLNSSGNLDKTTNGNAQVIINTPERVSITDSTLAQTGYNAVEIGLDSSVEPPKSVLIDGVHFNGALTNNAISIFGTADDAVVTISNCDFSQVSNVLRISNRTNTKVTINLINCTFGTWESGEYAGAIICQDYTSTTAEETISANRFAPNKVIINMIGCSHNGTPITFSDPSTVIGTGDENQLLYVYLNKGGGLLAYTSENVNRFPSFSAR